MIQGDPLHDAAMQAVEVASLRHREALESGDAVAAAREELVFVRVLRCAESKGLTVADLCRASALDGPYLWHLLRE